MLSAMTQKQTKTAGFSLIELLFAMVFLSVIIFGVIRLQTSNMTLSHTKQLELKAHFYASQALEIADAFGSAAVIACQNPCYLSKPGDYALEDNGAETLENDLFQRTITHDETNLTGATLVTAQVGWTDSSGDHSVQAKKVITN